MKGALRADCARILNEVLNKGRSLSDVITEYAAKWHDSRDRALLQAISYGVCRWYFRLENIAQQLIKKPFKKKDHDIYCLLLVGLYQLINMRVPDFASVTETVAATKTLKKDWAKGVVNAVLREFQRQKNNLKLTSLSSIYAHPDWIIEKCQKTYPFEWEAILEENNRLPPFSLRVNPMRFSREAYLARLSHAGILGKIIPETRAGIVLEEALDVQKLPGFLEGDVSVQDGAAQLAVELLDLKPNQRVLDACAAPGGKTGYILEMQPTIQCVAVDHDPKRLALLKDNLNRLNVSAICFDADVAKVDQWWDGKPFDRILLDAPCSASGVIRRHPDIKLLRRVTDISNLSEIQLSIMNAAWPLLKENGLLLYVTCSIFAEENSNVMRDFLKHHPDAQEEKIVATLGKECEIGRQILPGVRHGLDGFFFARFRKTQGCFKLSP